MELGRSRPTGETPAQWQPRSKRRTRLLTGSALALTALTVAAVGWPGVASAAAIHSPAPGS
ncbi:MAG TPA: hypothetical protein VGY50_02100, partial [Streptosporangiaceae bacterium]|nr:hypothetical protein [Streptosporangiaceae bacterium]